MSRRKVRRGICSFCYDGLRGTVELLDFPRVKRAADDVLDEYVFMRSVGVSRGEMPDRLRMTRAALDQVLCRARRRGDRRIIEHAL